MRIQTKVNVIAIIDVPVNYICPVNNVGSFSARRERSGGRVANKYVKVGRGRVKSVEEAIFLILIVYPSLENHQ